MTQSTSNEMNSHVEDLFSSQGKTTESCKEDKSWRIGSCHCQSILFEVFIPNSVDVYKCNCSICWMKQNHHFVVENKNFRLIKPTSVDCKDESSQAAYLSAVSTYKFHTGTASHTFCKVCGVCPFYIPRSNPTGKAVTVYCMKDFPSSAANNCEEAHNYLNIVWKQFDGVNWEHSIKTSDISSKTP